MFGFIVLVIIICYMSRMIVSNWIDDTQGKIKYRNNRFGTYIDHNGLSRDINTNQYRSILRDTKGDVHIWGKDIGDINVSQHDREIEFQNYKDRLSRGENVGRTTIYWSPSPNYDVTKDINILGKRYKDLSTGQILIVRVHKYQQFYLDSNTLEVLRYTDSQKRNLESHNSYSKEKEIKDVAEFQKYIEKQIANLDYIGDPTKGIGSTNVSRLGDYWKGDY